MTLTEEQYSNKLNELMKIGWDIYKFRLGIQCRTTTPNPYCEKELDEIFYKSKGFIFKKDLMYFCPSCLKTLGFAQSRIA